jgi:putative peptide maturation dehydrogenase
VESGSTGNEAPETAFRRSSAFVLRYEMRNTLDLPALLRGGLAVVPEERLVACSWLTGETWALDSASLQMLSMVPSARWVRLCELGIRDRDKVRVCRELVSKGLLLSDEPTPPASALRAREERLSARDWDDAAALYHVASRSKDEDAGRDIGKAPQLPHGGPPPADPRVGGYLELVAAMARDLAANASRYGAAPGPFHQVRHAVGRVELALPRGEDGVFELLRRRRTIRVFDPANPMHVGELSTLLYYTFGCQGYAHLAPGLVALRKTSPSGGGLHPIEAYPLVVNVRGLETGLYHYNVERHALDLLRPLEQGAAESLAELFTLGQSFFRSANVLFVLTARWYRNFWKYRRAKKSYRVIHVEAGHLSQTLYLSCTQLGLGAFYTGAINDANVEEVLGLDPLEEGVIGICGCGRPATRGPTLSLETVPYVPRETALGPGPAGEPFPR